VEGGRESQWDGGDTKIGERRGEEMEGGGRGGVGKEEEGGVGEAGEIVGWSCN